MAAEFVITLNRQLGDSIDVKLATKSSEVIAHAASAPVHNMHAERTLSMMDATLCFTYGKVKTALYDMLGWLGWLPEDQHDKLVMSAVSQGALLRNRLALKQKAVQEAVYNRYEKTIWDACENKMKLEVARVGL